MRDAAPIDRIFDDLRERYGEPTTGSEAPFRVLVATILSQRTNDDVTYPAANRLFDAYPDVEALAEADPERVAELIEPVGFYNTKGQAVVKAANHLIEEHGGEVPTGEDELLEVPWVGRKTMNCVRVYAFGEPVVAVDTHVHRISNRLGLVDTDSPEATEEALTSLLGPEDRRAVNELLVRFGREICRPQGPKCGDCPVEDVCPSSREREPEGLGEPEGRTMLGKVADEG